jgi:hypothetical protein
MILHQENKAKTRRLLADTVTNPKGDKLKPPLVGMFRSRRQQSHGVQLAVVILFSMPIVRFFTYVIISVFSYNDVLNKLPDIPRSIPCFVHEFL